VTTLHLPEDFESVKDGVMTRSMEGRIDFWNHAAEELYGWKKDEAIGKVSHDLLHTQFPKPLQEIESELVRNGRWEGRLVHVARDGRRVVVDSRWTFESAMQPGTLVEINRPSANLEAGIETGRGEIAKPQPVFRSPSVQLNNLIGKISGIVLAGGAFICIVMASYAFTKFFSDPSGRFLYGFVPIGVAAVLVACLGLKPNYKINVALACVSIAVSVYGMELFLELLDPHPKDPLMLDLRRSSDREKEAAELSKKFGVQIDPRSPGEVIADFNKSGAGAVPFVSPSNNLFVERDGYRKSVISVGGTEVIPLAGISDKLTLLCNENGQWITYNSDAHGFNNPDSGIWKSGSVDIVALGDSFPQGYCVPPQKSFIGLIRQRYPKTLNLGIAGDGPLMELAAMREYLENFNAKIVLWFYCEDNDLVELQGERRTQILPRYLKSGFKQNLAEQQSDIDDAMMKDIVRQEALERVSEIRRQQPHKKAEFLESLKLAMLRSKLNMPHVMGPQEIAEVKDMDEPNLQIFAQVLREAKRRVTQSNGKMYFVYLPSWARYGKVALPEIKHRGAVLSIVNSLQIPIINIGQVFDRHEDPLSLFPFRQFGHYNEMGHRLVAEELLKNISLGEPAAEARP
jgi:PAS domain S-box-containing protein